MTQLTKAIAFATVAHAGQTDKIGADYIRHPLRVMESLRFTDEATMVVGVLHDVIEDTDMTMVDAQVGLDLTPDQVLALDAVTRRHGETYLNFARRIHALPGDAGIMAEWVKRMDIIDNSAVWRRPPQWQTHPLPRYAQALAILNGEAE